MDVLNAIDRFEDTQRRVRIAADQLRPGLVASGSATLSSEPPYDYARFDLDEVRYSAGVSLDLPVDRRRERNTYRASLVSFESQVRSLSLTLDNFKFRIDDGLRTLEQRRLNFLNRQAALEVASRREELNRMLLEAGRAAIRDLRESQDQLITAQNGRILALVDYLRARLQLMLDIGLLHTEEERFWLKDPLAGRLTPEMRGPSPLQMPADTLIPPDRFLDPVP
jgi:outer membrane protein TolC